MVHKRPDPTKLWSAGKLKLESGTIVGFQGKCVVKPGDQVVFKGAWEDKPKYGWQFRVDSFTFDQDLNADGLVKYLQRNAGIGPAKGWLIAGTFGKDFGRVIEHEPHLVANLLGWALERVMPMRTAWLSNKGMNETMTWLASLGLSPRQQDSLVEEYGNAAYELISADPYILAGLHGFGFKNADKIAKTLGFTDKAPARLQAGLMYCLQREEQREGHCWLPYGTLLEGAAEELDLTGEGTGNALKDACRQLGSLDKLTIAELGCGLVVAKKDLYAQEEYLASRFAACQRSKISFSPMDLHPALDEDQRNAVLMATTFNIVLVSGGAGTGKTFTIREIDRVFRQKSLRVVLAAPTGKAAKRMQQLVGQPTTTIHRLLGFNGRSYTVSRVEADVVIVDEVSMVDVSVAYQLFRAVREDATIVLVGDHNQLPPIGPGNILRDLIDRRPIPIVILGQVHRQAGLLKMNSNAILRGEICSSSNNLEDGWIVAECDSVGETRDFIFNLFEEHLQETLKFDLMQDVQLLTPMKQGVLGTHCLNAELQRIVQRKLWATEVRNSDPEKPQFLLNDRVIHTRNNYKIGVMNGTIGTVVSPLEKGKRFLVQFEGRVVAPEPADVSLAYALTFHKAQGSEFPCAVVVVHSNHDRMHHRNLLYTGVTRASKTAIVVGDKYGIKTCATRYQVDDRNTFLSEMLQPFREVA